MKISDIKGPIAGSVNNYFYTVYENLIYEVNKLLDPNKCKRIEPTCAPATWGKEKGLFAYNKEIKDFLLNEQCSKYERDQRRFKTRKEFYEAKDAITDKMFPFSYENDLYKITGHVTICVVDDNNYNQHYIGYYTTITISIKDKAGVLADIDKFLASKGIKKKPLTDARGHEYKVGDTVAYSDSEYAAVQIGLVTKICDVYVEIQNKKHWYTPFHKEPKDMLIVSPFIQYEDI